MLLTHSDGKHPAGSHPTEAAKETKSTQKYALQAQECVNCKNSPKRTTGGRAATWRGSIWWFKGQKTRNLKKKKLEKQETWKTRSFLLASYVKYAFVYTHINICSGFDAVASKFIGYSCCPQLLFVWHVLCLSSLFFSYYSSSSFCI